MTRTAFFPIGETRPTAEPHEAWVAFSGEAELWWLRALKPGFRHCFVIARDAEHWLVLDPLSPHLEIAVLPLPVSFHLPHWLQQQGLTVVRAPIQRTSKKPAPFGPCSCVEIIKRFLGLHARHILTPWQLYRHLSQATPEEIPYGKSFFRPQNSRLRPAARASA